MRAAAGLVSAALLVAAPGAQDRDAAATVFVAVTGGDGAPVTGLGPADFVVEAGATPARVVTAVPATGAPAIVLIGDRLGHPESLLPVRAALRRLVDGLRAAYPAAQLGLILGPEEGVAAPAFLDVSRDADVIDRGVERYLGATPTRPLVESIIVGARALAGRPERRRLVIAVTNDWVAAGVTPRRAADVLREAGAQLWAVELWPVPRNYVSDEDAILREVTAMSGGRRETMTGLNPNLAVDRLVDAATSQYLVTFAVPPGVDAGLLHVGVRRDGVRVSAAGWRAVR